MAKLSTDLRVHLRLFAFYLANGTVHREVLPLDFDYTQIFSEPSGLEQVFAIWSNVLEVGEDGAPINAPTATRRAAQYIRLLLDSSYNVEPPFEEWELELH